MTASLSELFTGKIRQVEEFEAECGAVIAEVTTLLDESETEAIEEVKEVGDKLFEAAATFKKALDTPTITLATTGTTSGGKSTLVNMLCGAEIMPVDAQEMSAGTVEIHHHSSECILKIPEVQGFPLEEAGEWRGLSDEDIKLRLTRLMDTYRELREKNEEPPAPTIELYYPTRLGQSEVFTNLFSEDFPVKLRIMDLPGFKHLSDDHNKKVIQEKIKPALCLVTYNSEETDPVKQQKLLEEVVDQVKEMRGTPARMLFILNRIDVFLRDNNPGKKEEFKKRITANIRLAIEKALPEYSGVIRELQTQELSAFPSILAYKAMQNLENSGIYLKRIERNFAAVMPEAMLEDLPRKIASWKDEEKLQMAEAVWEASHGKDFDQALEQHIFNNLPDLLLTHLLKPLGDSANAAYTKAHQIVQGHLYATEEKYQTELARIEKTDADLKKLRDESKEKLLNFFAETDDDPLEILEYMARGLEEEYELESNSMTPLYDWYRGLTVSILEYLELIRGVVIGESPSSPIFDRLQPEKRNAINKLSEKCAKSNYRKDFARSGGEFKYFKEDAPQYYYLEETLKDIAEFIEKISEWVLKNHIELESERIQDALEYLLKQYADSINHEANKIGEGFGGINVLPSEIIRIKTSLSQNISFSFNIQNENCKKEKTVKKRREKRIWHTLFIKKRTIEYDSTIMADARKATIPSIKDLSDDFFNHFQENYLTEYRAKFYEWIKSQADKFLANVDDYHNNVMASYKKHLKNAKEHADTSRAMNLEKWQRAEVNLKKLEGKPDQLFRVN